LNIILVVIAILLATALPSLSAPRVKALLVGTPDQTVEFKTCLQQYGAAVVSRNNLDQSALSQLKQSEIFVICAPASSSPLKLSANDVTTIKQFIEQGGRAYIEYADIPDGTLPGWSMDHTPILNRFEMLAAEVDNPAACSLNKDDLLEEHNSYLLDFHAPSDAVILLNYGLYLGTYKVARQFVEEKSNFTVLIDLGSEKNITGAAQWFGGKNPSYAPDVVRFSYAGEAKKFGKETEVSSNQFQEGNLKASADFGSVRARYVRIWCQKEKVSPVTDFLKLDGVEVYDASGNNIAKGCNYTLQVKNETPESVNGGKLTSGISPLAWQEDRSCLYSVSQTMGWNTRKWNALAEWKYGKGMLIYSGTSLSVFRKHNYRLTSRWEDLIRGISLSLFPADVQEDVADRWIPLKVHTQPRTWVEPGALTQLHVETIPGATIKVSSPGLVFDKRHQESPGVYIYPFHPKAGEYEISVQSSNGLSGRTVKTKLSVHTRKVMYRRALDRNMKWFMNSGLVTGRDAGDGVRSTLEIGSLYAGSAEDLPSPYRVDCQSMSGKAFYLYGELTGNQIWKTRAENLANLVLNNQFPDPSRARFGGFKWLFSGSDSIYPQDDNNRNIDFLSFLWNKTGNPKYLEAVLRNVEMLRDTCREDGTMGWFSVDPNTLDSTGRFAMRNIDNSPLTSYSMHRFHTGWLSAALPEYKSLLAQMARIYGLAAVTPGAAERSTFPGWTTGGDQFYAYALNYLPKNNPLRAELLETVSKAKTAYLNDPWVKRCGYPAQAGDIDSASLERAFTNDSAIHTLAGEPITDQIYSTPWTALYGWLLHKAAPDNKVFKQYFETTLDYLVRIQFENPDSRLDGCWMRGFDMENWEYYGTRYDPNYGAYHAYTGWMNSTIDTALAWYLMDVDPFATIGPEHNTQVETMLAKVRSEVNPDYIREVNYLKGIKLTTDNTPDLGSKTTTTITDGIIEGIREDNLSAGWTVPAGTGDYTVELTADLCQIVNVSRLSIRTGALDTKCRADSVELLLGETSDNLRSILISTLSTPEGMDWLSFPPSNCRYAKIRLIKHQNASSYQRLYVGEIQLIGLSEPHMSPSK